MFSIWRRERGKKRGREISGGNWGNCGRRRRRKKKKKKREKKPFEIKYKLVGYPCFVIYRFV